MSFVNIFTKFVDPIYLVSLSGYTSPTIRAPVSYIYNVSGYPSITLEYSKDEAMTHLTKTTRGQTHSVIDVNKGTIFNSSGIFNNMYRTCKYSFAQCLFRY